jgi:choline dehydrogenase-like flavoprotein
MAAAASGHLPWGRDHHRTYRELLDHRVNIGVACDDLPEEHNRVTLDPELKDTNGIPAPRIDYTIGDNTRRMMEHGIARAEEILTAAGATRITCSRTVLNYPGHLLGTARMGSDPERSVVNEWGRSHDVKNLFIVDGSVFVTGGGVNPTSTIQAVALYIADQMKQRLANLFD